jgi:hypothetical protein
MDIATDTGTDGGGWTGGKFEKTKCKKWYM